MFSCECLNVIIETDEQEEKNDFQKVKVDDLSAEDRQDPFFKQDVRQIEKLININKSHQGLIQSRNVGLWTVHHCINCDVHSHAVHREKGASCVLISPKLLRKEAIERLKSSDDFSPLFKIIIRAEEDEIEDDLGYSSYVPRDLEHVIWTLKQAAKDALKDESLAVEERIKKFTDEQYNKLNDLRERAFREQEALVRIILNNSLDSDNPKHKPASTNQQGGMSVIQGTDMTTAAAASSEKTNSPYSRLNQPSLSTSPIYTSSNKKITKRQKSCPAGRVTSLDAEGLFDLDLSDDLRHREESETEESEPDDDLDNITSSRHRHHSNNNPNGSRPIRVGLAKSLPMTIPSFMSQAANRRNLRVGGANNLTLLSDDLDAAADLAMAALEDDEITMARRTPKGGSGGGEDSESLDIAASIKALARSVHGDAVFGDLPKPRYSTYI